MSNERIEHTEYERTRAASNASLTLRAVLAMSVYTVCLHEDVVRLCVGERVVYVCCS